MYPAGLHRYALDEHDRKLRRSEAQDRLRLEEQAARGWLDAGAQLTDAVRHQTSFGARLRTACATLFARVSMARG